MMAVDWEKLKTAVLIFVDIHYDDVKVSASGWWSKYLECFVFHHKSDEFYYYPDTNELKHCIDLWYPYRIYGIPRIGHCRKIKDFKIQVKKVIM